MGYGVKTKQIQKLWIFLCKNIKRIWQSSLTIIVGYMLMCHIWKIPPKNNYFSTMPGTIFLNSLGISIVQLHPSLKAMFSSTNLVLFFWVSGLVMMVLKDTFIRVFICLQENRDNPPHLFPGLVQITSVMISVNIRRKSIGIILSIRFFI